MRTPLALALALILPLAAACGDDEAPPPEEEAPARPAMEAQDTAGIDPDTTEAEGAMDEPAGPATSTDLPEGTLYTVQVGAFVEAANASGYVERLEEAGLPAWTESAPVGGRSFQRVRVGTVATPEEARRLGRLLEDRLGRSVWITTVGSRESLPAGVLDATRRLVEGG